MSQLGEKILHAAKRVAFYLLYPFYGYMDGRFKDLQARITSLNTRISQNQSTLDPIVEKMNSAWPAATIAQLKQPTADFMQWANSEKGFAAQAGLWFNPPVEVCYREGSVHANQIHERIVEIPFALASIRELPPDSLILDIGSAESTLSISLACTGYQVISMDIRPYPMKHPRITHVVADVDEWKGPQRPLDAIFCISTLEHLGLNCYGYGSTKPGLDRKAMSLFAQWLKPGGQLVLTVPYGRRAVTELERTYDAELIEHLLVDWEVRRRALYVRTAPTCWDVLDAEPEADFWTDDTRGVLAIEAVQR